MSQVPLFAIPGLLPGGELGIGLRLGILPALALMSRVPCQRAGAEWIGHGQSLFRERQRNGNSRKLHDGAAGLNESEHLGKSHEGQSHRSNPHHRGDGGENVIVIHRAYFRLGDAAGIRGAAPYGIRDTRAWEPSSNCGVTVICGAAQVLVGRTCLLS